MRNAEHGVQAGETAGRQMAQVKAGTAAEALAEAQAQARAEMPVEAPAPRRDAGEGSLPVRAPQVAFVTLGCAKNEVDTDKMRTRLAAAGYGLADGVEDADLVVVNTCSFLASATAESIDEIFSVLSAQEGTAHAGKVLVAGCMPSRYGDELAQELSEVAGFLAADEEDKVVEKVAALVGPAHGAGAGDVPDTPGAGDAANGTADAADADTGKAALEKAARTGWRSREQAFAYVKVSDGCDRFCSYCMIPHIRGRYRSFALDDILAEVGGLVDAGVAEIVFIGQDTGIWGADFERPDTLAHLLAAAAARFPDAWFRVMYTQPEGVTDELLALMRDVDNICPYLDIPLQHCAPEVLEAMNREGSPERYLSLVGHVRETVAGVGLRTTLMAGFPGETAAQAEALVDFADTAAFDFGGVFPYSREEGSAAAELGGQLPDDEKLERAQRLLDVVEHAGWRRAEERVGQVCRVLVESFEETDSGPEALCRAQFQAPEVDGQVHVPVPRDALPATGSFIRVRIVDAFCHELVGELVQGEGARLP